MRCQGIVRLDGKCLLVCIGRTVQISSGLQKLAQENIISSLLWIVLDRLLIGDDGIVDVTVGRLYLPQLNPRIRVVLIELYGFIQRGRGPVQVFLLLEQDSSQQIIKTAVVLYLDDLDVRRGNSRISLLLSYVIIH